MSPGDKDNSPPHASAVRRIAWLALVMGLAAAAYARTIGFSYVWDDVTLLPANPVVRGETPFWQDLHDALCFGGGGRQSGLDVPAPGVALVPLGMGSVTEPDLGPRRQCRSSRPDHGAGMGHRATTGGQPNGGGHGRGGVRPLPGESRSGGLGVRSDRRAGRVLSRGERSSD